MRPTLPPLVCITLLALSSSCTRSDQTANQERADEAKAKAREDGERIKADAKKLASDAKRDAQSLDQKIDRALHSSGAAQGSSESAESKVRNGTRDLEAAGEKAGVKLDNAALMAKVKAKLASDVGLSTVTTVDVRTTGDVVTLRGTVSTLEQKQHAEQAALQVAGVSRVVNELSVKP